MNGIKLSRIIGTSLLVLAIARTILYYYRPRPVPVVVRAVDRGPVARSIANTRAGSIKACRRSKLALPSGGQISRIHVHKGDHVRKDHPLLELWNTDMRDNIRVLGRELKSTRLHIVLQRSLCSG